MASEQYRMKVGESDVIFLAITKTAEVALKARKI